MCHWELAWIYRKLSRDAPKAIEHAKENGDRESTFAVVEAESEEDKRKYKVILALNYITPILSGVFDILYYLKAINDVENSSAAISNNRFTYVEQGLRISLCAVVSSVGVLQCISGVILIRSVFSIRNFFKTHDADEVIDTRQLVLHSSAFGIYLIAQVIYYGSWTIRIKRDDQSALFFVAQIGTFFYLVFNLVS